MKRRALAFLITLLATSVPSPGAGQASETVNRRFTPSDWSSQNLIGSVSYDGRYAAYTNCDADCSLEVIEVATGDVRNLTPDADPLGRRGTAGWAQSPSLSRDGEKVAFAWYNGDCPCYELRTIGVDGSNLEVLHSSPPGGGSWLRPTDWSPDGTEILVVMSAGGGASKIAVFPSEGGSARTLKSFDWRTPDRPRFSPDGRHIAYDLQAQAGSRDRDILVLAADASRETVVKPGGGDDMFLEWTPEGDLLVARDDASGIPGLWLEPMRDGREAGEAVLVRPEVRGFTRSLALTDEGSLYYGIRVGGRQLFSAPFDVGSGSITGAARVLSGRYRAYGFAGWSRDGEFMAFTTPSSSIVIRTVASGELRELTPDVDYFTAVTWSADGKSFLASGQQRQQRGLFRVDARTGELTRLLSGTFPLVLRLSPDGRTAYYYCRSCSEPGVYAYDVETGDVREVWNGTVWVENEGREVHRFYQQLALSPDGSRLALVSYRWDGILLMPTSGGPPKEIYRATGGAQQGIQQGISRILWAPDGEHLLARMRDSEEPRPESPHHLWRISVGDGSAQMLGALPEGSSLLDLHPDGRRLVFVTNDEKLETWVLDHVVPAGIRSSDSGRR